MKQTVIQSLSALIDQRLNCIAQGNEEWRLKSTQAIGAIEKDHLPHGSGIDRGTRIDLEKSVGQKIVLNLDFHHMDENGTYDGWTEHTVTVTPQFRGISIAIGGRNRNGIKEYLHDTLHHALTSELNGGAL